MGKEDDSSMGMNMTGAIGNEDSAMSIGKLGNAGGMGVDDSELSNNAIGVSNKKEKSASNSKSKKKPKSSSKKSKKSKKADSDDDDDDMYAKNEPSTLKINT